jgi:hypothetical protein
MKEKKGLNLIGISPKARIIESNGKMAWTQPVMLSGK